MGRIVRRVPMAFDWPMNKIWPGYMLSIYGAIERYYPDEDADALTAHFAQLIGCKHENVSDLAIFHPPTGEGWQMWEDTSEGSPMSPVFATREELARWLANYDQWLAIIKE